MPDINLFYLTLSLMLLLMSCSTGRKGRNSKEKNDLLSVGFVFKVKPV